MDFILHFQINDYRILTFLWNIFLALIPCFIVYRIEKDGIKPWTKMKGFGRISFVVLFLIWFFFFPNTAYLMTDVRHLLDYCNGNPGLLRICKEQAYIPPIFFTYALVGVPTFYYSLKGMAKILGKIWKDKIQFIFPIIMIPICSIGVMLGLVARFNTWDIVLRPHFILETFFVYLTDGIMLLNILSYTVMLYLIYYFIKAVRSK